MATNLEDYKIHLHYLLSKEGIHVMDAKVHNECERHFLRALDAIKQYTGDFQIEVSVPNEGGYIDEFLIKIADSSLVDLIRDFVVAFITYYFTKKTNVRDDILKGLDIVEKIKNGNFCKEEALALVAHDKKLKKIISDYYKAAEHDQQIQRIEVSSEQPETQPICSNICRGDFQTHIIDTESSEDTQTIEGTTIAILSPVLQKGHSKTWNGIYSGKTIPFKIEDKDFLKQVYANEIKFGSATTIKCTLQIKTKRIIAEDEATVKEENTYIVKSVQTWADDQCFQRDTKRYKKQKADDRQLTLDFDL